MITILEQLSARVREAMKKVGVEGDPLVRASQDPQFGDYQSNCAMGLAKQLGKKPRDVATSIVENLNIDDMCETPEIAGPGFINFKLKPAWLAERLQAIATSNTGENDRVGIEKTTKPQTVIVDLSSPNLAKEMHVGHLRSTVIGDCVARVLEFAGHNVIRENHVGDWGTQFGMLIAHLRRTNPQVVEKPDTLVIKDLETFYVEAKAVFDMDEEFKKESREAVVALQSGDPTIRKIWKAFCDESLRHCHAIYDRLGVSLIDRGESFYADKMDEVIARLEQRKAKGDPAVVESEGALCILPGGFKTREGAELPLIVRKSDGGANYATSDLAAIVQRVEELRTSRILYVVGISQKQHFEMVFAGARRVMFVDDKVELQHLGFGNVLAKNGKPFKTREGGTVKLKDLLDEAVERSRAVIKEQIAGDDSGQREFDAAQIEKIAETVGLAAVKYFDLSHAMTSDYKFDLDTMLAMEGNTAPYMLYAYARIRSIGRKAGVDFTKIAAGSKIALEHPAEIALAKKLLQFAETIEIVTRDLQPNVLTDYLYELSKTFSRFYDKKLGVRVIDASPESVRESRLRLCDLTARTLKVGLGLLGIGTLEQM